jgi:hypothetical protein
MSREVLGRCEGCWYLRLQFIQTASQHEYEHSTEMSVETTRVAKRVKYGPERWY